VLGGEHFGQLVHVRLDQALEVEHHPGAALRIDQGPMLLGPQRGLHGSVHLARAGQGHAGLHLAGVRIEHLAELMGRTGDRSAVDEMGDFAHGRGFRPLEPRREPAS
jgi:hypothetical protein